MARPGGDSAVSRASGMPAARHTAPLASSRSVMTNAPRLVDNSGPGQITTNGGPGMMGRVTWTAPTPPMPIDEPLVGEDRPMLEASLAWQRRTLLNLCAGLTSHQLASRPLASTNLSLLGLVRHLAKVERTW